MSKFLDQQGLQVLWDILKNGFQPIRRAEESEYSALFIPKDGEICIVDTVRDGVRIKIGDGTTYFNSLQYLNIGQNVIVRGFYFEGKFYYNSVHTQQMTGAINTLYIDLPTGDLYYYEEGDYIQINYIPSASATVAGVMRLYKQTGANEDGTMTQKSITDNLNTKFHVDVNDDGKLIFTI